MFTSDKDLKKAVPKKLLKPATAGGAKLTTASSVTGSSQVLTKATEENEVVAKARAERELRQVRREQTLYCLRVQAWWRGIALRKRASKEFVGSVTNKLADVKKLVVAMSSKGVSFVTPPVVSMKVLREFCVLSRLSPGLESLPELRKSILETMLLPSFSETDDSKNLLGALYTFDPQLRCLIQFISEVLDTYQPTTSTTDHFDLIEQLLLISQQHASSSQNKVTIAANKFLSSFFQFSLAQKLLLPLHRTAAKILKTKEENFLLSSTANQQLDHIRGKHAVLLSSLERSLTLFLNLLHFHYDSTAQTTIRFIEYILTIPCLTALLSNTFLQQFFSEHISTFSEACTLLLANSPQCQAICESTDALTQLPCGYTILANMCGFTSYFLEFMTANIAVNLTDNFVHYFQCMHSLLLSYPISYALQGSSTNGVIWKKQGIALTAIGISHVMTLQIHMLFDLQLLRKLLDFSLPAYTPVRSSEAWSIYVNPQELQQVEDALSNPSFRIVSNAFVDQQRDATSWISSKWAKKLGLSSLFGTSSSTTATAAVTNGGRKDDGGSGSKKSSSSFFSSFFTSSSSSSTTAAAAAAVAIPAPSTAVAAAVNEAEHDFSVNIPMLSSTCHLWSLLFPFACYAKGDTAPWKALSYLAFSSSLVESLFLMLHTHKLHAKHGKSRKGKSGLLLLTNQFQPQTHLFSAANDDNSVVDFEVLFVLIAILKMYLSALDDKELYSQNKPFPLPMTMKLISCLNSLLFQIIRFDPTVVLETLLTQDSKATQNTVEGVNVELERINFQHQRVVNIVKNIQFVLMDLYTRWSRRPFCDPIHWTLPDQTQTRSFQQELRQKSDFAMAIVHAMPWCILFYDRLKWMREELDSQKLTVQGSNDQRSLFSAQGGYRSPGTIIRVRRHRVLEDGMDSLNRSTSLHQWKDRFVVRYIDEFGNEEAGIDAGGLFKDFFTDLSSKIFDPNYGLFSMTSDNLLYPNPSAVAIYRGSELDETYYFVGRVLGKAIYENITIQPQFAHFFLAFIHGRYNFMNLLNDLVTLDAELFKNLIFLKDYDGDFSDLGLTFSVADTSLQSSTGQTEIDLIANGRNIPVTANNRHRYIQLIAKYYLHDRIKRQAGPFFAGLRELFPVEISSTYCPPELQVVISGSQQGISASDLKQHTQYVGGYFSLDVYMQRFWLVFEKDFTVEDQAALLKFVTACPRPPSLGFSALYPPFTIQRVECSDDSRLPTASTCFNILKLPTYSSQKVMREKLLLAIHSKSGFDLS